MDRIPHFVGQTGFAIPLTDAQIRAYKSQKLRYERSDGERLYGDVTPAGRKTFRLACRFCGKQSTLWIGEYPSTLLSDARHKTGEVKLQLRRGIDPKAAGNGRSPLGQKLFSTNSMQLWKNSAQVYLKLRQRDGAAPRTMTKLDRQVRVAIKALGERSIETITPVLSDECEPVSATKVRVPFMPFRSDAT